MLSSRHELETAEVTYMLNTGVYVNANNVRQDLPGEAEHILLGPRTENHHAHQSNIS